MTSKNAVVIATQGTQVGLPVAEATPAERMRRWLASKRPTTRRAYALDLKTFAAYIGEPGPAEALNVLVLSDRVAVLQKVEEWRDQQRADGLSSAVINRRLSSVRSALRDLGRIGVGPGRPDVQPVPSELKHGQRGNMGAPAREIAAALQTLEARTDRGSIRDAAMLRLALHAGLRRREIAGLTLDSLDLPGQRIEVVEKGKDEKTSKKVSPRAIAALRRWLAVRPACTCLHVFVTFEATPRPAAAHLVFLAARRLAVEAIGPRPAPPPPDATPQAGVEYQLATAAWLRRVRGWRPHGFRHAAATAVYKATRDAAVVQNFLGHADIQTTTKHYIDDKSDMQARAAAAIDDAFEI